MKRFAVVCGSYQWSDRYYTEKVDTMRDALESMARDGIDVRMFAITQHPHDYKTQHTGVTYSFSGGAGLVQAHRGLVRALTEWRPDAVVCKDFWNPVNSMVYNALPQAEKLLIFCGGELKPPAFHVDRVMVASEAMAQVLRVRGYRGEIVPRAFGVNCDLFQPSDVPKQYDLLYVADWRENKRQELLLDVMARKAMRVCFLGAQHGIYNQEYFDKCMRRAARLGVRDRMILVDRMPGHETVKYYQQARAAIHLGLKTEGGARSPLEAMACELPVIVTTDCLSNCSRIEHLTEGFHAEPTAAALAHACNYMLNNPAISREFGQAGRRKVLTLWHGGAMEEDFRRLLV